MPVATEAPPEAPIDILLVDDDRELLTVYLEILGSEGIKALGISSGEEVLSLLPQIACPKLILVDFMMPGLGGKMLFEALRTNVETSLAKVYSFSALDRGCDLLKDASPFVSGFVDKPSDLTDFVALIADLLQGRPNRHVRSAA